MILTREKLEIVKRGNLCIGCANASIPTQDVCT